MTTLEKEYEEFMKVTEEFIQGVITKKYLLNDEKTYNDIINKRFLPILNNKTKLDKTKLNYIIEMFLKKRCVPAGSILSGLGNTEYTCSLSNCYYIPLNSDSLEGIFECEKEIARTFSWRGGCGLSISILRPSGCPVKNSAKTSTGAVSFMPSFSQLGHDIGQNGRRAAELIDIDCRHPDLEKFIWSKANPDRVFPKDFMTGYQPTVNFANISVQITNKFMEAVKTDSDWDLFFPETTFEKYDAEWDGNYDDWIAKGYPVKIYKTVKAKDILKQIAEASWLTGDPGIIFRDNMRNFSSCAFDPKLIPVGCNPCLPEWAPVLTPEGYKQLKDIKNEIVLGGETYECSDVFKTRELDDVYEIELMGGIKFWSTYDHEIMATKNDYKFSEPKLTKIKDLNVKDFVKMDYTPIKINIDKEEWKNGYDYVKMFDEQTDILMFNNINFQLGFIEGIYKEFGYIDKLKDVHSIDVTSKISSGLLGNTQLILCSLGIFSDILENTLRIMDADSFEDMFNLTNKTNSAVFTNFSKDKQHIKSITKLDGKFPVYDISVPGPNKFVSSAIVISNCGEQSLQSYGNCLLSAICLHKYVKNPYEPIAEFDIHTFLADTEHLVYFLDEMINLNNHPLNEQNLMDKYSRRMGIEFTGMADMISMLNMDYGSDESCDFLDDILFSKAICEIKTSIKLAKEKGYAPCFKTKKSRTAFIKQPYIQRILNNLLKTNQTEITNNIMEYGLSSPAFNTVGPTGSISIVADNCTSGIEPIYNISYYRKSRLFGDKQMKMVHLPLIKHVGPKILSLTDEEIKKKYHYQCAHEIDYITRIKVQSTVQKWTDNSISSTINLNNDATIDDIYNIYLEAYDKQLKGITIFRDGSKKGILSSTAEESSKPKEIDNKITSENITNHLSLIKDELTQTLRAYRYVRMWKGNKVYITITIDSSGKPVEIFANVPYEAGIDKSGVYHQEQLMEKKTYWDTICRLISLMLRLNMPIPVILKQLDKSSPNMVEMPSIIAYILKKYVDYTPEKIKEIKETKLGGEYCQSCGEYAGIFQGGCLVCQSCGDSKCG